MTEITLEPGTYRLTETVTNPRPDRRHRYKWRLWPKWEKGMTLVVSDMSMPPPEGLPRTPRLEFTRPGGLEGIPVKGATGQLLAAKVVRLEETPSNWLQREHGITLAPRILDHLVRTGALTDAQVRAAYEACNAADPEG